MYKLQYTLTDGEVEKYGWLAVVMVLIRVCMAGPQPSRHFIERILRKCMEWQRKPYLWNNPLAGVDPEYLKRKISDDVDAMLLPVPASENVEESVDPESLKQDLYTLLIRSAAEIERAWKDGAGVRPQEIFNITGADRLALLWLIHQDSKLSTLANGTARREIRREARSHNTGHSNKDYIELRTFIFERARLAALRHTDNTAEPKALHRAA